MHLIGALQLAYSERECPDIVFTNKFRNNRERFQEFPDYLKAQRPKGFIAEQVLGFNQHDDGHPERKEYLVQFMELASSLGYSARAMTLHAGDWSEANRDRWAPRMQYCQDLFGRCFALQILVYSRQHSSTSMKQFHEKFNQQL